MAENIPIRDESMDPNRPFGRRGWSLERLMRVSWGAIFAGFVVAFATQVLLLLLGAAIGLTVFDPGATADPQAWGWGVGLWWIVSTLVSLFVGGLVAGRLAGIPRSIDSMLHGAATWALVIVASLLLSGAAVGQLFNMVSGIAGGVVPAVVQQQEQPQTQPPVAQQTPDRAEQLRREQQIVQDIRQAAQRVVPQASPQVERSVEQFISDLQAGEGNTDQLVDAMTRAGVPEDEAQDTAERWVQWYSEADLDQRIAERAATTGAGIAWLTFIAMLLGAAAAMGGGWLGTPQDISTLREGHYRRYAGEGETMPPPTGV